VRLLTARSTYENGRWRNRLLGLVVVAGLAGCGDCPRETVEEVAAATEAPEPPCCCCTRRPAPPASAGESLTATRWLEPADRPEIASLGLAMTSQDGERVNLVLCGPSC
jgi:hypothetical protein